MDNIELWTAKTIYYFLAISQVAFYFLKYPIYQAVIRWIHEDESKNCWMAVLLCVLFIKIQELKNHGLLDVTPILRNQNKSLAVLNHWCCTHSIKSEIKFCCSKRITRWVCSHNVNYQSSDMNAATVSKIINQRSYCWLLFLNSLICRTDFVTSKRY